MERFSAACRGFFQLARVGLSAAVALTALTGFVCARKSLGPGVFFAFAAIFLLASSASAFNQCREIAFDARMERTKKRPLPSLRLSLRKALLFAALLGTAGSVALFRLGGPMAALLGLCGLGWYGAVYTPLKRRTRWALFIGAFAGALPPAIGCVAAGGALISNVLVLALFIYLWQIPHFLLVLLKYGQEYRRAGFLNMSKHTGRLKTIALGGVGATAASTVLFWACGLVSGIGTLAVLLTCGIAVAACFLRLARADEKQFASPQAFGVLYAYQACVLGVLIFSALGNR